MKKWLLVLGLILVAWFGLKDIAYSKYLTSGPAILPPPVTYTTQDSWAAWPEPLPGGAWETPWGIDAFVILPPSPVAQKHGLIPADNTKAVAMSRASLTAIREAIPSEIPVYAPFYRAPAAANSGEVARQMKLLTEQDLLNAFKTYLETANQGRGIMIVIAEPSGAYSRDLIDRAQAEDLADRFAGLISFQTQNAGLPLRTLSCSPALLTACHQQVEVQTITNFASFLLPRVTENAQIRGVYDASGVTEAIRVQAEAVSSWLDENAPKPAEPFGFSNVIEAAPIYRPGADEPLNQPEN